MNMTPLKLPKRMGVSPLRSLLATALPLCLTACVLPPQAAADDRARSSASLPPFVIRLPAAKPPEAVVPAAAPSSLAAPAKPAPAVSEAAASAKTPEPAPQAAAPATAAASAPAHDHKASDKPVVAETAPAATPAEPEPLELPSRPIAKVVPPPWNYRPPVPVVVAPPPPPPEPVTVVANNIVSCVARRTVADDEEKTAIACRNASGVKQAVFLRIQASGVAGLPPPEVEKVGHLLAPGETKTLVALAVVARPAQVAFSYTHQPRP
ncbi:MAG: hypothetical protein V4738_08550 [Pseudomonadota bacterium]